MTKQITTPWGYAERVSNVAHGIKFASTPSHGGFHLTADRQAAMPDYFREIDDNTRNGWYEEDCHAAFVVLVHRDVPGKTAEARANVGYFFPDLLARFEAGGGARRGDMALIDPDELKVAAVEAGIVSHTELTECGEQHVIPGCERDLLGKATQGSLWD